MMKQFLVIISVVCLSHSPIWGIVIDQASATALNQVVLYEDSTFIHHSEYTYKEGEMFRIIGESRFEHPDADQKQKFKWYKVETPDQQIGWIYGDGLAVYVQQQDLNSILRPYHRKKVSLGSGFERAITWVASIQGRDNFHEQDYMNPLYNEYYLVVTNTRGRSVMMKCAGESARGETAIRKVDIGDITGDGNAEFIVQHETRNVGSHIIERNLEIYSMKAGTLALVFEENLALAYENGIPSPSLYKHVEIEKQGIRISYVDYLNCDNYGLGQHTDPISPQKERCLEYVTSYFTWDKRTKTFQNLYGNTRLAPKGGPWSSQITLRNKPSTNGAVVGYVNTGETVSIIKHYEEYVLEFGKKKIRNWFRVADDKGRLGYVNAEKIGFIEIEHADILNSYYLQPPLSKSEWKSPSTQFLHMNTH